MTAAEFQRDEEMNDNNPGRHGDFAAMDKLMT
jgi:hypothetical protein